MSVISYKKSSLGEGQYDDGYSSPQLLWGNSPAGLVKRSLDFLNLDSNIKAADLGCGEGKNSYYLALNGVNVSAFDISSVAIQKAMKTWPMQDNIVWTVKDIRKIDLHSDTYDLVLMTGPLHCLNNKSEVINVINKAKEITKVGGLHVLSIFNSGKHDFSGHDESFSPILLTHEFYLGLYSDWEIIHESNKILDDIHPHNGIPHFHSITRLLLRRIEKK